MITKTALSLAVLLVGGSAALAGMTTMNRAALAVPRTHDRSKIGRMASHTAKPTIKPFPTNAWWSGGSLEAWPAPLYAWPLVVDLSKEAVTIDARSVHTEGNVVRAVAHAPLYVRFDGSPDRAAVSSFGDWDVTFDLLGSSTRVARVTAVQGSPFAWIESDASSLAIDLPGDSVVEEHDCAKPCASARVVTMNGTSYLVATTGTITQKEGRLTVAFARTGTKTVSVGVMAPGTSASDYLPYALAIPRGTSVAWKETGNTIETTFTYPTKTIMGLLPHHLDTLKKGSLKPFGTYQTLRGPITVAAGASFTTRMPKPAIDPDPPLHPSLKNDAAFLATLKTDVDTQQDPAAGDSYFAGKQLLRSALLAKLADGTNDSPLKKTALKKASDGLAAWCGAPGGGSFSYDRNLGGIVGDPTSFGSEHYNDHHYHYGYVIHAAAIVAALDPTWTERYGDCIDLLVRDVAAGRNDPSFPFLRYMDAYAGHSWANGLTRFADGQNQESVSEAVQAWYAVALWGDRTGQKSLSERGRWLMAEELQGAKSYWFNAGATKTLPADAAFPMISILWGGKADYATFFDASDAAIRGIQFFPAITGISGLLNASSVELIASLANADDTGLWTNHLRMVAALAKLRTPDPGRPLDAFYSESYVRNWLATY